MLPYCLMSKKNTDSIDLKVSATNNRRTMILSKCAIFVSKKSKFIKKQEAKGLLSNLGIKTPLSKCGYQRGLASMVYTFFDKKTAGNGVKSMSQNEQLAEELHKPIISKF